MNRRSNARGPVTQQQQRVQQQYDSHFVPSNGNQQQQQTPVKTVPQPAAPITPKPEPIEQPPAAESMNLDSGDENNTGEGGIGAKMRKIFAHRKNLSPADRKKLEKERKARQLRRLRKLLTPKNAVVALHELQGPGMSEFVINTNGQETTAEIVVNNVRYEATAPNKHLAKAKASEKALRDLVIAQMSKAKSSDAAKNGNSDTDGAANEDVEMAEVTENDDVPMLHLASYALYKLFNEWQNEGFEIPAIKPVKPPVKLTPSGVHPLAPKVPKTKADLPADAATRHPTALLAYMRPQVPYEDLGSNQTNDPTKREFSVGVTVDGERFIDQQVSRMCRQMFRPQPAQELIHSLQGYQLGRITYDRSGPCHESSGFLYHNNRRYFAICSNQKEVKTAIAEQIFRDIVLNAIRTVSELTFPDAPNPMAVELDSEQLFGSELFPLAVTVSFALYKLDREWDANLKKEIPLPKFARPIVGRPRKSIRPMRELPKNVKEMHPGMVIVHMCPRHKWDLLTKPEDFDERNPWYKYVLDVEGDGWKQYEGEGRSKKDARWYAAAAACKDLFGVEYQDGEEEEEETEVNYEWNS